LSEKSFIWQLSSGSEWIWFYLAFIMTDITLIALLFLVDRRHRFSADMKPLLLIGILWLILLPLIKFGCANDLRIQAGTPALLIIGIVVTQKYFAGKIKINGVLKLLAVGLFLIGASYPISRPLFNLWKNKNDFSYHAISQKRGIQNLSEFHESSLNTALQYLGQTNSFAARWLLR